MTTGGTGMERMSDRAPPAGGNPAGVEIDPTIEDDV